jgi:tetratricopeptide (TPR) repeat protein
MIMQRSTFLLWIHLLAIPLAMLGGYIAYKKRITITHIPISSGYSKYKNKLIIASIILLLIAFSAGVYFPKRHIESSIRLFSYSRAIKKNLKDPMAYYNRAIEYLIKREYDKAVSDLNKVIELNPEYAMAYNVLARVLATCPDGRYRNGVKAVELAEKALAIRETYYILDTLAAAYAEAGRFKEAIATQEEAIALSEKQGFIGAKSGQYIEHLNSFKANKAWREK